MERAVRRNRFSRALFASALSLLALCAVAAKGAPQAGPEAEPGFPALAPRPAETTPSAAKAMMLSATRAGRRIVVVGDHGIVLLSDSDGADFRQAKSVPVRSTLAAVHFVDENTGWAVGHWGVAIRTDDGGETWRLQRLDLSVDQPLFSVYFRDRESGWAVGLWSLAIVTHDGGKTWAPVRIPPPPGAKKADRNLLKIFANRMGTLFVAAEQGMILRSFDGESWSYIQTGYKGTFWTGTVLNNGTMLVGGLRGTIYRSVDDGRSWRESKTDPKASITDFAEAGGKVIAVGLDGVVLESSDGGATFRGTQRDDRLPFTSVAVASNGRVVMFSKQGVVAEPHRLPGEAGTVPAPPAVAR